MARTLTHVNTCTVQSLPDERTCILCGICTAVSAFFCVCVSYSMSTGTKRDMHGTLDSAERMRTCLQSASESFIYRQYYTNCISLCSNSNINLLFQKLWRFDICNLSFKCSEMCHFRLFFAGDHFPLIIFTLIWQPLQLTFSTSSCTDEQTKYDFSS